MTNAQRKTKTPAELVADAARKALMAASGDVKEAVAKMEAAVRKDTALRFALTEPLISGACYDAVRAQSRGERRTLWGAAQSSAPEPADAAEQTSRVVALAKGSLLMFPLPGGKALGEATRGEVTAAADFYERQAGDMETKSRWLRLVAQSITGKSSVKDVLSNTRLRELQREARNG